MEGEELTLRADGIHKTIERLRLRITDRFPDSGLSRVCERLLGISETTEKTVEWIDRPIYALKILAALSIAGLAGLIVFIAREVGAYEVTELGFSELIATTDSAVNLLILLSVAFIFLWSLEIRIKRNRVVQSINKLRDVAHVIDMHQLTKDPDGVSKISAPTKHSPQRTLNAYELGRYLDYCTEMLALLSKLGYLYITRLDDSVATNSATELESLTTDLSRKIWQKIIIVKQMRPEDQAAFPVKM
jgi:hypothetical protein